MAGKRSYDDGCAAAHGLDLVGERWALLVVRELALGPRRFTDLRNALPGISPNVLAQRLHELEAASIVVRRRLPPPAAARAYALTDWGTELEPILRDIGRWAARSPVMPQGLPLSVNSLILSLRTMFDAGRAKGVDARIELRLNEQAFRVAIADGRLDVAPGHVEAPDAVISCGPDALAAVVYGGEDLDKAIGSGAIRVEGDPAVVRRLTTMFPLPDPAPVTGSGT
jgi:DNA-binding HxlR family transcriptional regulator